jgi:hypothetical protein
MTEASSALKAWESFYVIVGSSAGALTGLQFIVMTLIAEAGGSRGREETISAFGTPNIVHFCAALLVSAIFSAPWGGLAPPGVAIAALGVAGLVYSVAVLRRARRQQNYTPVLEDWIWHAGLPILAYAGLLHSGIMLARVSTDVLYVAGGAVLLLVFIGIHNAWDTVMYITVFGISGSRREEPPASPSPPRETTAPGTPPNSTAPRG